jgi:hypothetical protein
MEGPVQWAAAGRAARKRFHQMLGAALAAHDIGCLIRN